MAALITAVSINPNPVDAGGTIIMSAAVAFPALTFNELDGVLWDNLTVNDWDDLGGFLPVAVTNDQDASVTYAKTLDPTIGAILKIDKPNGTDIYSSWQLGSLVLLAGSHTLKYHLKTTAILNMTGYTNNLFAEIYLPSMGAYSMHVGGTTDWTEYTFTFSLAADDNNFRIWLVVDRAYGIAEFGGLLLDDKTLRIN